MTNIFDINRAYYPTYTVQFNKTPNRFWAFPILGMLIKIIILIPVFIEFIVLEIAYVIATVLINSLIVLLTGKYWHPAYLLSIGLLRLQTQTSLFIFGLSDVYPHFNLTDTRDTIISMPCPVTCKRLYAIPILGGIIRFILLIPYFIYSNGVYSGGLVGVVLSFLPVLFNGYYPISTFELGRDAVRLGLSSGVYFSGLSDEYPSFAISLNQPVEKLLLIIFAAGGIMPHSSTPAHNTPYKYGNSGPTPQMNYTIPSLPPPPPAAMGK